jgi:hypothetical protein
MSSISHYALLCMVLTVVLCCSSVSALNIVDTSNTITITGQNGIACIPEEITIQGTTNYNTDNRVIVEISPVGFTPASKTEPQEFNGAVATVTVQNGIGTNFWQMSTDTGGWQPGMYLIQASVIGKELIESEFITLQYCTDITPTSFLPTVTSQNTHGDESTVGSETTSSSITESSPSPLMTNGIEAPTTPISPANEGSSPFASEVPTQSTPRSPSWFGLAVLACLGAFLLRKV